MVEQPSIEDLLLKHRDEIEKLKELVSVRSVNLPLTKLEDPLKTSELFYTELDNLFYLRHVLSAKAKHSIETQAENVVAGLEWRLQHLDKRRSDSYGLANKLAYSYTGDLPNGSPVAVLSLAQSDLTFLMKLNEEMLDEYMKYEKEKLYQICDQRTRATKKLVKALTVVDAKDIGVYQGRAVYKVLMMLNKSREFKPHPQLQEPTVVVNVNWMAKSLTKGIKKISTVTIEDFHKKYDAKEAVPSFVGGLSAWKFTKPSLARKVPQSSNSNLITEGSDKFRLGKGNSYKCAIPIDSTNSVVSLICDTQSMKTVRVTAYLELDDQPRINFAPMTVNKKIITFPLGDSTGKFVFKIKTPGNKIKGQVKNSLKRKHNFGQFTYRVEVPGEYNDVKTYLPEKETQLIEDNQRPVSIPEQPRSAPTSEKRTFVADPPPLKKAKSIDPAEKYDIADGSFASYFKFLIPLAPTIVTEALLGYED